MKNNAPMVRLGDYIEVCNTRNPDLKYGLNMIEGVNSKGEFCPPKAAVEGINLLPYKIVDPGDFVYNPSRLNIGSLALRKKPRCIVSHLYVVFRLTEWGKKNFLEDYLYLFFSRQTFRDLITYRNFGSQRPEFNFYQMCEVEVPKPSLDTQRELVAIYDGLKKIVAENEALIKPLEEACRSFLIDLKQKFSSHPLGKYIEEYDRRNSDNLLTLDDVRGISIEKKFIATKANMDGVSLIPYKVVEPGWFCYVTVTSRNGEKISLAHYGEKKPAIVSSSYIVFRSKDEEQLLPEYLYLFLCRPEFDRYSRFNSWGSARETFDFSEMCRVEIPVPPIEIQRSIAAVSHCLETAKRIIQETRERMKNLCPALVQKAEHSA